MQSRILITMGDPYGIGPEVVVKALLSKRLPCASYRVVGIVEVVEEAMSKFGRRKRSMRWPKGMRVEITEPSGIEEPDDFADPKISEAGGRVSVACIRNAVQLLLQGDYDALVTAPICKESMHRAGFAWPGQTEMLAELSGARRHAMMFSGPKLKVSLVTIHTAIRDVPLAITSEKVSEVVELTHHALVDWFGISEPRLAVAGLNPHAGEGGAFGDEDDKVIRPALDAVRRKGVRVEGPLPADTLFYRLLQREFDAAVCMYHDQALAPFKMIHFKDGVNMTLGLPFIRTSPDHGTAFDIAWKNRADPSSMEAAIGLACRLSRSRRRIGRTVAAAHGARA